MTIDLIGCTYVLEPTTFPVTLSKFVNRIRLVPTKVAVIRVLRSGSQLPIMHFELVIPASEPAMRLHHPAKKGYLDPVPYTSTSPVHLHALFS